jgi:signal transduction histidine kinase
LGCEDYSSFGEGVMVILDIQERSSWMFVAEAGAWKQILMSLFGNALKYTEEGYVKVSLSTEETETSAGGAIRSRSVQRSNIPIVE